MSINAERTSDKTTYIHFHELPSAKTEEIFEMSPACKVLEWIPNGPLISNGPLHAVGLDGFLQTVSPVFRSLSPIFLKGHAQSNELS
jgi:hypothetical protein